MHNRILLASHLGRTEQQESGRIGRCAASNICLTMAIRSDLMQPRKGLGRPMLGNIRRQVFPSLAPESLSYSISLSLVHVLALCGHLELQ